MVRLVDAEKVVQLFGGRRSLNGVLNGGVFICIKDWEFGTIGMKMKSLSTKESKMEKNRRETMIHSEGPNEMNGDEAETSPLDGHDENEPGPMERTKEVMENIGTMINNI